MRHEKVMSYHNARLKRSILLFFPAILQSTLWDSPSYSFCRISGRICFTLFWHKFYCLCGSESWRRAPFPLRQRLPEDLSDQCLYVGNSCFPYWNRIAFAPAFIKLLVRKNPIPLRIHQHNFYLLHRQRKPDRFPAYSRVRASTLPLPQHVRALHEISIPSAYNMCLFDFAHRNAETFQFCGTPNASHCSFK